MLKMTMKKHGESLDDAEIEKLFKETDHDNDGRIGFEDFVRMMMSRWIQINTNKIIKQ